MSIYRPKCAYSQGAVQLRRAVHIGQSGEDSGLSRRVMIGTASMLGARGFALAASFLSIAVASRRLSPDAFGLWSILSSFAFFGATFDLGLGQGMRNRLATLAARPGDGHEERNLFFAVLYALTGLTLVSLAVIVIIGRVLPWASWLGAQGSELADIVPLVATIVAALFVLNIPLNLNGPGFLAYQEANRRSAVDVVQSAFLLVAVITLAGNTSFVSFIASYYILFDGVALLGLVFFIRSRGWSWPSIRLSSVVAMVRPLLVSSLRFWLLGVSALLIFTTDPIIAGRVLGLAEAGDFNVVQKLFTVLITVHFTVLTPLWSAYTRAAENDDWAWIDRALKRSLALTVLLVGLGALALVLLSRPILRFWVGREIDDISLVLALGVWASTFAIANCYSVLLNGLNQTRRQTILAVAGAIVNWPLSLWLGRRFGAQGIVEGTILVVLPAAISNYLQVRAILREKLNAVPTPEAHVPDPPGA